MPKDRVRLGYNYGTPQRHSLLPRRPEFTRTHASRALGLPVERLARGLSLDMRRLLVLLALAAAPALADMLEGRVVGVADGDTLTVLDSARRQHKVRLAGIDGPARGQPFGNQSKQSLAALAAGKTVMVEWHKRDRYGRLVGKVLVAGADVNLEQVRRGLAWHYREYENEQTPADRTAYGVTEYAARTAGRGLWADRRPVPPWEFRRTKRPAK